MPSSSSTDHEFRDDAGGLWRFNPLAKRAFPHEILDEGNHPDEELFGTFRDMQRVNNLLGGTRITMNAVTRLTGHLQAGDQLSFVDIGAGHADIPRAVLDWATRSQIRCHASALDLDLPTLTTATRLPENGSIDFVQADIQHLPLRDRSVDIAMSSMTFHHLTDETAIESLKEMARVARLGIVVNDLTRTLHGYTVAWILGRVATSNRLTRHDAHRSIQRSRTEPELEELVRDAGLQRPVFDSTLGYRTAMTIGVREW